MLETIKTIISMYTGEIVTGFVTAFLSHILYKSKLKKEQKVRFQDVIGEAIAKSLLNMKKLCVIASGIEKYAVEEALEGGEVIKAFDLGYYPEIMNDGESLSDFISKIVEARQTDESNLSRKAAAHLYYIEKYMMELISYIKAVDLQNHLPEAGCIFIVDIQNWQHSFDRVITRDINRHATKMSLHRGVLWEREKEKMRKRLYSKSILVLLQKEDNELTPKERDAKALINELLKELIENE